MTPPPPPPPDLAPPPGYAAFDNRPTQAATRRIGGLGKAVVVLVVIAAVAALATALFSTAVTQDAEDFLAGDISEDDFQSAIAPLNAVQLVSVAVLLATGVLTIIWMYRMAANVRAFGRATTWHPLFAVFGWLLPPLVLYVIPFLVLRELWKASAPTEVDGGEGWKRERDNPVLWVWFVLFGIFPTIMLAVELGNLASAGLPAGDYESIAESLEDFAALDWIVTIVNIGAAITWLAFVRQLTARHVRLTGES